MIILEVGEKCARLIDRYGWGAWYPVMGAFGLVGGTAMLLLIRKQKRLLAEQRTGAVG